MPLTGRTRSTTIGRSRACCERTQQKEKAGPRELLPSLPSHLGDCLPWRRHGLGLRDRCCGMAARLPVCGRPWQCGWRGPTPCGSMGCAPALADTATLPPGPGRPTKAASGGKRSAPPTASADNPEFASSPVSRRPAPPHDAGSLGQSPHTRPPSGGTLTA